MTDRQIEKLIHNAEKSATSSSFLAARIGAAVSALLTPLVLVGEIGVGLAVLMSGIGWGLTYLLWLTGRDFARECESARARVIWKELGGIGILGEQESPRLSQLIHQIGEVYTHDPQGEVLPLMQAVRLTLAWKQQRQRLILVEHHVRQMVSLRESLLEKRKSLRELGDESLSLEPTLAQLDGDIEPLERSAEALRASCGRLEALVLTVDATARRRQLHREIGELTAQVPLSVRKGNDVFETQDEQLDLERQIGREIETYLKLEIETNAHLRDL